MPIIEPKSLTEFYEIRHRINQEIKDMNNEERTAYFRRNVQAALAGRSLKVRTEQVPSGLEERKGREASLGGAER